jgi:hypothetical protein
LKCAEANSEDRFKFECDIMRCIAPNAKPTCIALSPTSCVHCPLFSLCSAVMLLLPLTLVFSSWHTLVRAGSQPKGQSCSVSNNRLQIGTYQFHSDCDAQTYCSSQGICELKGCRKDQYPFGYPADATLPPKCPSGQFCPDEGDACQPWLPVGSACQLNRDGELR